MSTCSTVSRDLDEPVSGTAPVARTWLLLEQPGPWGAKALTSSHLDPALGRALDAAAKGTGVRVALVRRPGATRTGARPPHAGCTRPTPCRETYGCTAPPSRTPVGCSAWISPRSAGATTAPSTRYWTAAPTRATRSPSSAPTANATGAAPSSAGPWRPNSPPPEPTASGKSPTWAGTASRRPCSCCPTDTSTAGSRPTPSRGSCTRAGGPDRHRGLPRELRVGPPRPGGRAGPAIGPRRGRGPGTHRGTDGRRRTALGGDPGAPRRPVLAGHRRTRGVRAAATGELHGVGTGLAGADGGHGGARPAGCGSGELTPRAVHAPRGRYAPHPATACHRPHVPSWP